MASRAYINTIASLSLARAVAGRIKDAYGQKKNPATVFKMCDRIEQDVMAALDPYLKDASICQFNHRTLSDVDSRLQKAAADFESDGEHMGTWLSMLLAQLDDLCSHIKDSGRKARIERVLYGVKAMARYFDRKQDDYIAYDRASDLLSKWEDAIAC